MQDETKKPVEQESRVSRRDFLKISGASAATVPLIGTRTVDAAGVPVKIQGPGKTPITLTINGQSHTLHLEPRVTLLDAMRDRLAITGAKRRSQTSWNQNPRTATSAVRARFKSGGEP